MVALRAHGAGERAARVGSGLEAVEHVAEVVTRLPAELPSRTLIDINPFDFGKHSPTPTRVLRLVGGYASTYHVRGVHAQARQGGGPGGRGRAQDGAAETGGGSLLDGEHVCGCDVLEIHAPVEILVRPHVVGVVCL